MNPKEPKGTLFRMRENLNDVDGHVHTYIPKVIPRIARLRYARPAIKNGTFELFSADYRKVVVGQKSLH